MKRLDAAFRKMPNVTFRGMPVVEAIWEAYLAKMGPESAPILLEAAAGAPVRRLVKTHRETLLMAVVRPGSALALRRARRPARRLRPPRAPGRAVGLHREELRRKTEEISDGTRPSVPFSPAPRGSRPRRPSSGARSRSGGGS